MSNLDVDSAQQQNRFLEYLRRFNVRTLLELQANPRKILTTFGICILIIFVAGGISITISVTNQSCVDDDKKGTTCWFNNHRVRDTTCSSEEERDTRFSYDKVNFFGIRTGRCYCCNGTTELIKTCWPTGNSYPLIISSLAVILVAVVVSLMVGVKIKENPTKKSIAAENLRHSLVKEEDAKILDKYFPLLVGADNYVGGDKLKNINTTPRSNFSYDSLGGKVGEGLFGVVYHGTLLKDGGLTMTKVAIKTVKPDSSQDVVKTFLNEINILTAIGKHRNIVELLGCCIEDTKTGRVYELLEYCNNGDLQKYLRTAQVQPAIRTTIEVSSILEGYMTIKDAPVNHYAKTWKEVGNQIFPQFVKWAKEIAEGMCFLSSKKVLHVDLAARNVLLDDNLTAKIGDFGLSRQLYSNYEEYDKTGMEPIPIRWVALECITQNKYSVKSDVWSYGVTLWEIFSFGKLPYDTLGVKEMVVCLINGVRLPCPKHCTPEVFCKISDCWKSEPADRPTFEDLANYFSELQSVVLK